MKKGFLTALFVSSALLVTGCNLVTANQTNPGSNNSNTSAPTQTVPGQSPQDQAKIAAMKEKIYPGVKIEGIDVSNLTVEQATEKVEKELISKVKQKKIQYTVLGDLDYTSYNKLKVELDPETIKEAVDVFDKKTDAEKIAQLNKPTPTDIKVKLKYDKAHVDFVVSEIKNSINTKNNFKFATLSGGKIVSRSDVKMITLDEAEFRQQMEKNINASLENVEPFAVKVNNGDNPISAEVLASMNVVISEFTTDYSYSIKERKHNIKVSSDKVNNTIVMPGSTFSLYGVVGDITAATGYQSSMVYIGNKMVPEVGGGVCQLSTTIYNAVLRAGMIPTVRHNHSMVVSYVPRGMDAAIYFPNLDFKFKNTLEHPIFIQTIADGSNLTIKFWGNKDDLKGNTYKFRQETYEKMKSTVTEVPDPTMYVGERKTDTHAFDGYKVKVYRQTFNGGKMVKEELITDDEYRKVDGIIKVGTKQR